MTGWVDFDLDVQKVYAYKFVRLTKPNLIEEVRPRGGGRPRPRSLVDGRRGALDRSHGQVVAALERRPRLGERQLDEAEADVPQGERHRNQVGEGEGHPGSGDVAVKFWNFRFEVIRFCTES